MCMPPDAKTGGDLLPLMWVIVRPGGTEWNHFQCSVEIEELWQISEETSLKIKPPLCMTLGFDL